MKVYEFIDKTNWCAYVVIATNEQEARDKLDNEILKQISKEATLNNLNNTINNLNIIKEELDKCVIEEYELENYVGVFNDI